LLQSAKKLQGRVPPEEIAAELQSNFQKTNRELGKFSAALRAAEPQLTKGFKELFDMRLMIEFTTLTIVNQLEELSKKQKEVQNLQAMLQTVTTDKELQEYLTAQASQKITRWRPVATSDHNTLCGHMGCYKNCHLSCSLTFSPDITDRKDKKILQEMQSHGRWGLVQSVQSWLR